MVDHDPASILRGPEPEPDLSHLNGHLPRVDMEQVMTAGYKIPQPFAGLVYPGRVHTLAGPPEAGKTVVALWLALKAMERGHRVLMLDEETGRMQIAELLKAMGADPAMIGKRLYYTAFNDLPWKADDIETLAMVLDAWKPKLTIFDSAGEMLASAGIDENNPADVTRFYKLVLRPVAAKFKSSVLLLDHDSKDKTASRYARGSTAKLAVPDVALKLVPLRPFSRTQDGVLGLNVSKDRLGGLHRWYRVRVSSSPLSLEFTKSTRAEEPEAGGGLSPAADKLLDVLTEQGQSSSQLVDAIVAKYGHGLRRETVSRTLTALLEQGLIDRMDQGAFQPVLWVRRGQTLMDHAHQAEAHSAELIEQSRQAQNAASDASFRAGEVRQEVKRRRAEEVPLPDSEPYR